MIFKLFFCLVFVFFWCFLVFSVCDSTDGNKTEDQESCSVYSVNFARDYIYCNKWYWNWIEFALIPSIIAMLYWFMIFYAKEFTSPRNELVNRYYPVYDDNVTQLYTFNY